MHHGWGPLVGTTSLLFWNGTEEIRTMNKHFIEFFKKDGHWFARLGSGNALSIDLGEHENLSEALPALTDYMLLNEYNRLLNPVIESRSEFSAPRSWSQSA
jgi:hypothetical protein